MSLRMHISPRRERGGGDDDVAGETSNLADGSNAASRSASLYQNGIGRPAVSVYVFLLVYVKFLISEAYRKPWIDLPFHQDKHPIFCPTVKSSQNNSKNQPANMEEDLSGFWVAFGGSQVCGILVVILVAIWTGSSSFLGGFAWRSSPSLEFNWHPLLMTVGFIFLYGNSIMIYRTLRGMRKDKLKLIHAALPVATLICIIIAQVAVFDSHNLNKPPIPNLYSLHSWIGLGAILLYVIQWVIGLVVFLYPGASAAIRSRIMSWHVFSGLFIFTLVILASLTGLTEKAIFKLGSSYGSLPGEGVLLNFIGVFIVLFAVSVVYVTTNPKFKRYPRPEDGALLTKSSVSE